MKSILLSFNFILANVAVRFLPTRLAVAALKRIPWADLRLAWSSERLAFLYSRKQSVWKKKLTVMLYYRITPIGYGIAWGCGMESSFRLAALMDFSRTTGVDLNKWMEYEFSFLRKNIEWHTNNNHLLVCLIVAHAYIEMSGGVSELSTPLIRELNNQFNTDGSNFEASTHYHILALSAVFWLCKWSSIMNSKELLLNYNGATLLAALVYKPRGWAWIGDNDSSILGDPKEFYDWLGKQPAADGLHFFGDFAAVILKRKSIRLGLWSTDYTRLGHAGHKHDDWGSITLAAYGAPLFVDPGVFTYSHRRDINRSRMMHNTIRPLFDGGEIIKFDGNFRGSSSYESSIVSSEERITCTISAGKEVLMARKLSIKNSVLEVEDTLLSGKDGEVGWIVNTHDWDFIHDEANKIIFHNKKMGGIIVLVLESEGGRIASHKASWSPSYFELLPATRIKVKFHGRLSWKILF